MVPALMQTTALSDFPPAGAPATWRSPAIGSPTLSRSGPPRPSCTRENARQTLANLVLGLPGLLNGVSEGLPTQLEQAVAHQPTFALVALGFTEVLEAAVAGRPTRSDRGSVSRRLREAGLEAGRHRLAVLLLTIPDPIDTAYFSSLDSARPTCG